jgi:hypothetical protein
VEALPPLTELEAGNEDSRALHLPGAPAGNLGDPIAPLPPPPSLAIAPVTQAPIGFALPVSDLARPVTDFPTENGSPEAPGGASRHSGGSHR